MAKKSPSATKTKPTTVTVRIDAATKRRYDALLSLARAANTKEASGFDAKWEAVREIVDHRLYVVGGYDDPDAWITATLQESPRQARRFMRIAQYASPVEEARYSTSKLDAALAYVDAKLHLPPHGALPVALERLRIPVTRDGEPRTVSLDEATADEVANATRAIEKTKRAGSSHASPVADAFVAALHGSKELRSVAVHFSDGHVTFARVPMGAFEQFLTAVRRADWRGALKKAATRKAGKAG